MTEFTISEPFEIDDGELAGLTTAQAFVLGVEWAFITRRLETQPSEFVATVHQMNVPRLRLACQRRGRSCQARTLCGTWAELSVGAKGAS